MPTAAVDASFGSSFRKFCQFPQLRADMPSSTWLGCFACTPVPDLRDCTNGKRSVKDPFLVELLAWVIRFSLPWSACSVYCFEGTSRLRNPPKPLDSDLQQPKENAEVLKSRAETT